MSAARFEVVHSGPYKFHARFVAGNNETVWVTESYRTRRAAMAAVVDVVDHVRYWGESVVPIRGVDERKGSA